MAHSSMQAKEGSKGFYRESQEAVLVRMGMMT